MSRPAKRVTHVSDHGRAVLQRLLAQGPARFGELSRAIGSAECAQALAELEAWGVVMRDPRAHWHLAHEDVLCRVVGVELGL